MYCLDADSIRNCKTCGNACRERDAHQGKISLLNHLCTPVVV